MIGLLLALVCCDSRCDERCAQIQARKVAMVQVCGLPEEVGVIDCGVHNVERLDCQVSCLEQSECAVVDGTVLSENADAPTWRDYTICLVGCPGTEEP